MDTENQAQIPPLQEEYIHPRAITPAPIIIILLLLISRSQKSAVTGKY